MDWRLLASSIPAYATLPAAFKVAKAASELLGKARLLPMQIPGLHPSSRDTPPYTS